MLRRYAFRTLGLFLICLVSTATNANAAKYIYDGWTYDDGSKSSEAVKLEIVGRSIKVEGLPYVIVGESLNLYRKLDEVFLTLDRVEMDGFAPMRVYNIILSPCKGSDEYSMKQRKMFGSCTKHQLVRIESPTNILLGMSKTTCELF